ncbi:MAG TPA: alpha/beta hydrolase [Candidatus Eisenbacteria bacterium]|nr:alpha/beta hydrolase [Candidatus Eisenbacteria bacterium]
MDVLGAVTEQGVTERRVDFPSPRGVVPGIVWVPEGAAGPRPLVLLGHGGTQHKRVPNILALARRLVRHLGYAAVALDAPHHGDRVPAEERGEDAAARRERLGLPEWRRRIFSASDQMGEEWRRTLDAVQALDEVGAGGPVGYWGVSMGTRFGVPLLAAEPRVTAAVLGLAGLPPEPEDAAFRVAAGSITIPLLFVLQWDDELVDRERGIALYTAFGSAEKTMHVNPGPHVGVPRHEGEEFERFFLRHLGRTPAAAASASSI